MFYSPDLFNPHTSVLHHQHPLSSFGTNNSLVPLSLPHSLLHSSVSSDSLLSSSFVARRETSVVERDESSSCIKSSSSSLSCQAILSPTASSLNLTSESTTTTTTIMDHHKMAAAVAAETFGRQISLIDPSLLYGRLSYPSSPATPLPSSGHSFGHHHHHNTSHPPPPPSTPHPSFLVPSFGYGYNQPPPPPHHAFDAMSSMQSSLEAMNAAAAASLHMRLTGNRPLGSVLFPSPQTANHMNLTSFPSHPSSVWPSSSSLGHPYPASYSELLSDLSRRPNERSEESTSFALLQPPLDGKSQFHEHLQRLREQQQHQSNGHHHHHHHGQCSSQCCNHSTQAFTPSSQRLDVSSGGSSCSYCPSSSPSSHSSSLDQHHHHHGQHSMSSPLLLPPFFPSLPPSTPTAIPSSGPLLSLPSSSSSSSSIERASNASHDNNNAVSTARVSAVVSPASSSLPRIPVPVKATSLSTSSPSSSLLDSHSHLEQSSSGSVFHPFPESKQGNAKFPDSCLRIKREEDEDTSKETKEQMKNNFISRNEEKDINKRLEKDCKDQATTNSCQTETAEKGKSSLSVVPETTSPRSREIESIEGKTCSSSKGDSCLTGKRISSTSENGKREQQETCVEEEPGVYEKDETRKKKSTCIDTKSVSTQCLTNQGNKSSNFLSGNNNKKDSLKRNACKSPRRTKVKSGLDMIRPSKKKKTRVSADEETSSSSKTSQDACLTFIEKPVETKKLMANKALGETVLHRAARQGYRDVVQSCLQSPNCDVNVRDNAGYTPLHECVTKGHLEIVRLLLMHGADPEASAAGGIKPIHDAVECDHIEVTRLLLSYGADPTISTYGGMTPLKLSHSKAMALLLQGFLSDLNGEVDSTSSNSNSVNNTFSAEDLRWKFSSFRPTHVVRNGFDIFAEAAPEAETPRNQLEVVIEESDHPLCPTFDIRINNKKEQTFVRLRDVLEQLNVTRSELESQVKDMEILALTDFPSRAKCKQLNETDKELRSLENSEDVVLWSESLRQRLGVRRIPVSSSTHSSLVKNKNKNKKKIVRSEEIVEKKKKKQNKKKEVKKNKKDKEQKEKKKEKIKKPAKKKKEPKGVGSN